MPVEQNIVIGSDAYSVVQNFGNFRSFKTTVNLLAQTPYGKNDLKRVYNLIQYAYRFQRTGGNFNGRYDFFFDGNELKNLLNLSTRNSLASTISRLRPILAHLPRRQMNQQPNISLSGDIVTLRNFHFIATLVQNMSPVARIEPVAFRTQPQAPTARAARNRPLQDLLNQTDGYRIPQAAQMPTAGARPAFTATQVFTEYRGDANQYYVDPNRISARDIDRLMAVTYGEIVASQPPAPRPAPRTYEIEINACQTNIDAQQRIIDTNEASTRETTERIAEINSFIESCSEMNERDYNEYQNAWLADHQTAEYGYSGGGSCECFSCRVSNLTRQVEPARARIRNAESRIENLVRDLEYYHSLLGTTSRIPVPEFFTGGFSTMNPTVMSILQE